ncbi:MAG: acyloxyacyl hydrolase [Acidobacteriia bacterium]|nr:acyloxyacyl hydrolase [Terriglobia bacterium]
MKRLIVVVVVLLLCAGAWAQDNPLRQPVWEIGPWFGGGTGLGHASEFKFINTGLRFGRVLTGELGSGRLRGTFEWAADIMPVYEVRQSAFYTSGPQQWIYSFAANPVVLKYNWTGGSRVAPYFAAEGGLVFSSTEIPPGDTSRVNFMPGGAFGLYLLRRNRQAVDLSVHMTHISNASLAHNPGINATVQFRVGYTWFK